MKPGDRVKVMRAGHPAWMRPGVVLGFDEVDGRPVAFVAVDYPGYVDACGVSKIWPIFVIRLTWLTVIAEADPESSRRLVDSLIDIAEDRGVPLRGLYAWAGPYRPKGEKITG